jgi:hypothetical protein
MLRSLVLATLGALTVLPSVTPFAYGPAIGGLKLRGAKPASIALSMNASPSRREALGVLAGAGAIFLGQKQANAKDVADGGLPGGLKELFGLMQTKKQVRFSGGSSRLGQAIADCAPSMRFAYFLPLLAGTSFLCIILLAICISSDEILRISQNTWKIFGTANSAA